MTVPWEEEVLGSKSKRDVDDGAVGGRRLELRSKRDLDDGAVGGRSLELRSKSDLDDGAVGGRSLYRKSKRDLNPVPSASRYANRLLMTNHASRKAAKVDGALGGRGLERRSKSDLESRGRLLFQEDAPYARKGYSSKAEATVRTLTRKKDSALVCVSIDFGTTYSGFAYSFKSSPSEIIGRGSGQPVKTQTVVLLDPQKNMVAFGDQAKTAYQQLVKSKQHTNWYLFERFKMALFVRNEPLDKNLMIEDILGKKMRAMDIFSLAIKFIKSEVMKTLTDTERMKDVDIKGENEVHWVLTVPAIWNDLSKTFMRDAATNAGIPDEMLTLALEPEAASLYCKEQLGLGQLPAGHRYMVLDLGGGTADITVHEVNPNGTLTEIHQPTGGDFGGTNVDDMFVKTLVQIFGAPHFQSFKKNYMDEYLDFMQNFETKKRHFDGTARMTIQCPLQLKEMYRRDIGQSVETALAQTPFAKTIEFRGDKIMISVELAKSFFDDAIGKINKSVEDLLKEVNSIDTILMVGGLSESPYLQAIMRHTFGDMVTIPQEPSSAVLHGAVMFGHNPLAITARVCQYTYGIARVMKFKQHHPPHKKVQIGDTAYCDDIFNKHIEIGTKMRLADAENVKPHEYFPTISEMKQAVLEVYASTKRNPKFVDEDGCQFVGLIKVDIDPQGDIFSKLLVKLMFGGTELRIQVRDVRQNIVTNASVDFLG